MDVQHIEEGGGIHHALDAFFVAAAPARREIAGGDFYSGIAGPDSRGQGAEQAGVIGVAPLARFIADLHGVHKLALAGGAEFAGEDPPVSPRVRLETRPVRERDGFKHERHVDVPSGGAP